MKRRKEEIGIGREESERRKGHRQLHILVVSFFQTLSLSLLPSLSTFCVSTLFSPLLAFLSASLSLLVPHSQFPSVSPRLNLFSYLSLSQSLNLSLSVLSSVFLFSLSIYLPLSPLSSTLCLSLVSIFCTISLALYLFSVFASPL